MPFSVKEDLTRLDSFNAQSVFLAENRIETIEDLDQFREKNKSRLNQLSDLRRNLRNQLKRNTRAGNEQGAAKTKKEIEEITGEMTKIRKLLKLSDTIEERSKRMSQGLTGLQDENKEDKESEQLFERSSRTGNEDIPGRN